VVTESEWLNAREAVEVFFQGFFQLCDPEIVEGMT